MYMACLCAGFVFVCLGFVRQKPGPGSGISAACACVCLCLQGVRCVHAFLCLCGVECIHTYDAGVWHPLSVWTNVRCIDRAAFSCYWSLCATRVRCFLVFGVCLNVCVCGKCLQACMCLCLW